MPNRTDREEFGGNYELKPYDHDQTYPLAFPGRTDYQEPDEDGHLRDYLNVIRRRKWIVILFTLVVVTTVLFATLLATPIYKATAVIKIDKDDPYILSFKDVQIQRPDEDYYETQYKILKSRSLAERVVTVTDAVKTRDFLPPPGELSRLTQIFSGAFGFISFSASGHTMPAKGPEGMDDRTKRRLAGILLGNMEVTPVKKSRLVQVSYMSHNPELSKTLANAIAESYIDFSLENNLDASREARLFLERQLTIMKTKVEETEAKLNDYSAKNEMIFLDGNKDNQSILTLKLSELSTALSAATAERIQKEALYKEVRESGTENSFISNNTLIQELKKQYALLESEYFNLLKVYKPDYPKMIRLKSQMNATRKRLDQEKNFIVKSIKSDYNAALKRESFLSSAYKNQKDAVLNFQKREVQYQILKRENDTNKELYNTLLQRLKEVSISSTKTSTNIQILDRAETPSSPFKPRKMLNFILSLAFGLFGGIGLAFFMEYFDNTVKNTHEIERRMQLPTLGMIPQQKSQGASSRLLITKSGNDSPIAEAFRSIGTFIILSSSTRPPKSILVTSPGEKEGKTTVCVNTAVALSEPLGNGILIDADLRKPKLHQTFDLDNRSGLSSFLAGRIELDDLLADLKVVNGVNIMTSGPVPPNPSELLVSARMKDLVDALYSLFNFIVIDSVPIMGMPESVYLSSIVDGTILVVKADETPKNALLETKRIFRTINARILGVVLNGINPDNLRYSYYSYYYTSYFK